MEGSAEENEIIKAFLTSDVNSFLKKNGQNYNDEKRDILEMPAPLLTDWWKVDEHENDGITSSVTEAVNPWGWLVEPEPNNNDIFYSINDDNPLNLETDSVYVNTVNVSATTLEADRATQQMPEYSINNQKICGEGKH